MQLKLLQKKAIQTTAEATGDLIRNKLANKIIKLLIILKQSTTDAIETASEKAIQTTAEATGDLIGNKLVIKLLKSQEIPSKKKYRDSYK